jgi:hypothetical protein
MIALQKDLDRMEPLSGIDNKGTASVSANSGSGTSVTSNATPHQNNSLLISRRKKQSRKKRIWPCFASSSSCLQFTRPGPYLPKWQQAPVIPIYAPYNWDALSHLSLANAWPFLDDEQRVVMSDVTNLPDLGDPESINLAETNNLYIKDYIGEDEDESEPFSDLYYPILVTAADAVTIPDKSGNSTINVLGIFAITFFWRDLLKDILPTGSDGVVVVVRNDCNQTFCYGRRLSPASASLACNHYYFKQSMSDWNTESPHNHLLSWAIGGSMDYQKTRCLPTIAASNVEVFNIDDWGPTWVLFCPHSHGRL